MPETLKPNLKYKVGGYGYSFTKLAEAKKFENVDVLFLGSSQAYRSFDPRIFKRNKLNIFNLGTTNQTPIQTRTLIEKYLDILNPKIIIFQVSPMTFTFDGVESGLDIISNDKIDYYSIKMALKLNNIKVYNTLAFGLINGLFFDKSTHKEHLIKGEDKYISGGFVEKKIKFYKKQAFKSDEWKFDERQLLALDEILKILKAKEVPTILVNTPVTSAYYNSYSNNTEFDSIMESKAEYLNFNKILQLDDSLNFYDPYHLNQNGVNELNPLLIPVINKKINSLNYLDK